LTLPNTLVHCQVQGFINTELLTSVSITSRQRFNILHVYPHSLLFATTLYLKNYLQHPMLCASMSPRHVASSGCLWEDSISIWSVAVNIFNKQSRTADSGWSSSLVVGIGANNISPLKKRACNELSHGASDSDGFFGTT
jgi:hypothetical protein